MASSDRPSLIRLASAYRHRKIPADPSSPLRIKISRIRFAQVGRSSYFSRCPYIYAYSPALMPQGDARIYLLAAMDLAFVVSVFLMGGEFWEKVRRIFVYEGK